MTQLQPMEMKSPDTKGTFPSFPPTIEKINGKRRSMLTQRESGEAAEEQTKASEMRRKKEAKARRSKYGSRGGRDR